MDNRSNVLNIFDYSLYDCLSVAQGWEKCSHICVVIKGMHVRTEKFPAISNTLGDKKNVVKEDWTVSTAPYPSDWMIEYELFLSCKEYQIQHESSRPTIISIFNYLYSIFAFISFNSSLFLFMYLIFVFILLQPISIFISKSRDVYFFLYI